MSFAQAIGELQTALASISGVSEAADPRIESLQTAGGGDLDGRYLLRAATLSTPWPDVSKDPSTYTANMVLQICKLLHNDELDQIATLNTWGIAAVDALLYASHAYGCVLNSQEPRILRNRRDRRIVWEWRFDLRYGG